MNRIKWIKSGTNIAPSYDAKIGCINLLCRSEYNMYFTKRRVIGWNCSVYIGNKWINRTKTIKSLELAQKKGEELAIEHLFGYGFVVLKELKKMGLLEEMLSEVGVDLE